MAKRNWLVTKQKSPKAQLLAIFSYLGVLCLVPVLFNKEGDEYVHFHSRQGLVLWIWGVLAIFSLYIPVLGGFIFSFSVLVISLYSVVGVISVLFTRAWRLPFVGHVSAYL